jgi:L-lactate dehydrogenase complex protein LldE
LVLYITMKIQIFIPCFIDQLFPETAFNMVKVLKKFNCEINYNINQTCCGQPAFNAGYWNESKSIARKFLNDFQSSDYIIVPSGSCTGFVRNYYPKLLGNSLPDNELTQLRSKTFEFTEFLTKVLKINETGAVLNGVASYHDSCGALRECGIKNAPRDLLSKVSGLHLKECIDSEVCCGFGGLFAVKFEPISIGMAEQKVLNAINVGADYLISTDLSCLMHLQGYIQKHKHSIKTMHIADVLASGW